MSFQRFEYKTKPILFDDYDLNKMGEEGWELIGIIPDMFRPSDDAEFTGIMFFKREKITWDKD